MIMDAKAEAKKNRLKKGKVKEKRRIHPRLQQKAMFKGHGPCRFVKNK